MLLSILLILITFMIIQNFMCESSKLFFYLLASWKGSIVHVFKYFLVWINMGPLQVLKCCDIYRYIFIIAYSVIVVFISITHVMMLPPPKVTGKLSQKDPVLLSPQTLLYFHFYGLSTIMDYSRGCSIFV